MLADLLLGIPDRVFELLQFADDTAGVIGGVLIGAGLAGRRVGWSPRCRACGFDVRGVPEEAGICPECGADLRARRGVQFGVRSRRWGMAAVGAVLVLAGIVSTLAGVPYRIMAWRDATIAAAFSYDQLMDRALAGDAKAVQELTAELSGTGRRRQNPLGGNAMRGCLIAIIERMEQDPASRAVLMPLATNPQPYMFTVDQAVPTRFARILTDVAESEPALLAALPGSALNQLFGPQAPGALAQLVTSPAMVRRLFAGGPDAQMISDATNMVEVAPSFGGSGTLWTHNSPFGVNVVEAAWRPKGAPDSDWRPAHRIKQRPFMLAADLTFSGLPEKGPIEVRAGGELLRREPNKMEALLPAVGANGQPLVFEWRRTFNMTPRSEVNLTPLSIGVLKDWAELKFGSAALSGAPGGPAHSWTLTVETATNFNGGLVMLTPTLVQGDRAWKSTQPTPGGPCVFDAPDLDPRLPFKVWLDTDLERIRATAQGDATYYPVCILLAFEAMDRPPKSVEIGPSGAAE